MNVSPLGLTPREAAIIVAKNLDANTRISLPIRPSVLVGVTEEEFEAADERYVEKRASVDEEHLIDTFRAFQKSYQDCVETNRGRLRGLLWARWRLRLEASGGDAEAQSFADLVEAFIADEWGVSDPPDALQDRTKLVMEMRW